MAKKVLTFFVIAALCWFEISCAMTSPQQSTPRRSVTKGPVNPPPGTPKDQADDVTPKTKESLIHANTDRSGDLPIGPSAFDQSLKAFRDSLRVRSHRPFSFSQTGVGAWEQRKPGPLLTLALIVAAAVVVVVLGALLLKKAFNPH